MANITSNQSSNITIELVHPNFSSITNAKVISYNISMSSSTRADSVNVVFAGRALENKIAGQEASFNIGNKKTLLAINSIRYIQGADNKITTEVRFVDFAYYLDTYLFQTFATQAQPIGIILRNIFNTIGMPSISLDPGNANISWVNENFKMLKTQNTLDYINTAINPSGHKLLNWWIDIFGVLHIYNNLQPSSEVLNIDLNKTNIVSNLSVGKTDPNNYRAHLDNVDYVSNEDINPPTRTIRDYNINNPKNGEFTVTRGGKREVAYDSKGVLYKGNVNIVEKISSEVNFDLIGTHYIIPHTKVVLKNTIFGDLGTSEKLIVKNVNIVGNAATTKTTVNCVAGSLGV